MLSARDYFTKCWNYKLQSFRRCSLPETLFFDVNPTSLISLKKSPENGWNDSYDSIPQLRSLTSQAVIMPEEEIQEFGYNPQDFVWHIEYSDYVFNSEPVATSFDLLLQSSWKSATEKNVFRYKLNELETKVLPGKIGFVAQLNPKRAFERRAPQPFYSIKEPFDPNRFNFTKIKKDEILFSMLGKNDIAPAAGPVQNGTSSDERHFIIANISPLEYCNVLLVPRLHACRPQIVTEDMLRLALHTILLSGTWKLRVGFNSLGALASVNHLHCHAYYLGYNIPAESLSAEPFMGPCHIVTNYPAQGFVFQFPPITGQKNSLVDELSEFIRDVYKLVDAFHKAEIPHNLFITRGTPIRPSLSRKSLVIRVYVWTREFCYGAKETSAFNAALCEISGHLPVKTEEHFRTLTESEASDVLREVTSEMFLRAKPVAEQVFSIP